MFQDKEKPRISMKGWLLKWTNFVKGYRRRWFVLSNGDLHYYRNKSEIAHEIRGTVNLLNALFHSYDDCAFVISRCDSKEVVYLKAANSSERQKWLAALEVGKAWAINDAENNSISSNWLAHYNLYQRGIFVNLSTLGNYFETIQNNFYNIDTTRVTIKQLLEEFAKTNDETQVSKNTFLVTECVKSFKGHCNNTAMMCNSYLNLSQSQITMSQFIFDAEVQNRNGLLYILTGLEISNSLLEDAHRGHNKSVFDELKKHSKRELKRIYKKSTLPESVSDNIYRRLDAHIIRSTQGHSITQLDSDDDNMSVSLEDGISVQMIMPEEITRRNSKGSVAQSFTSHASKLPNFNIKKRRKRIPDKPNNSLSLWGFMKNCIGKDLSKIPMPVHFSEPLSFLQRVAEDFAYSDLLDVAADCDDPLEELAYLAAFTISCYSTTANRHSKPFNPLLGETFEWDRTEDLGWRVITEQVSHHPPISAQYCEGRDWTCWQEISVSSKFRGKYLMVAPLGISHIVFHNSNNHYTWTKVTTTVNNIILGKLWVDNFGEMDIINHTNGSKCHIQYFPYSIFKTEEQRKVYGQVINSSNQVKWIIRGKWDTEVTIAPVTGKSGKPTNPEYLMGPSKQIWTIIPEPEDSYKYYNFTEFACQLNEMEEGIAPTDSRLRPDQRLMEEGKWDDANTTKTALEQKQRTAWKKLVEQSLQNSELDRSSNDTIHTHVHEPKWFKTELDTTTGRITYVYIGGYWEAKENAQWESCPDIFL